MDLQALSDEELVRLCVEGRQAAWSVLVRRFQRLIFTVARRSGLNDAAVHDVFQLTFVRLYEHIAHLKDPSRVRAWLVTTAKRETLAQLRLKKRESTLEDIDYNLLTDESEVNADENRATSRGPTSEPMVEEDSDEERWLSTRLAVDRLDARCKQLIEFLFFSEPTLAYAEIAARLGWAVGSVGQNRIRCLEKLRALLGRSM